MRPRGAPGAAVPDGADPSGPDHWRIGDSYRPRCFHAEKSAGRLRAEWWALRAPTAWWSQSARPSRSRADGGATRGLLGGKAAAAARAPKTPPGAVMPLDAF